MAWWWYILLIVFLGVTVGYVYWKFFMPKGGPSSGGRVGGGGPRGGSKIIR